MDALGFTALLFVAGGLMTLERRCLGRMAIVQPLALTVIAGAFTEQAELGLWMGVCLQLFAINPGNQADWALSGIIAAACMLGAQLFGIPLELGSASAILVIAISIAFGYLARVTDRYFARFDGKSVSRNCPLICDEPLRRTREFVIIRIARSGLVGGLESVSGTAVALGAAQVVHLLLGGEPQPSLFGTIAAPTVAVATAIGALAGYRVIILSGLSMAIAWVVVL